MPPHKVSGVAIVAISRRPPAHPIRSGGQPAAIVIGQTQPPGPKLTSQEPVLFDQVGDRLPLPAIQPAGQHTQHHLQRRGVDHGSELISRAGLKTSAESWNTFMKRPVKLPRCSKQLRRSGQTSSERARPFNQPRGRARERVNIRLVPSSSLSLAER